eukprot:TRINITY_DN23388_c0_g2_i1.p2 TRINITY_DN23388_c0_g2~~TRINITY_DN23388_c0_g2_i1.p2  ORF type:complete len:126 (+),score=20.23 TRINITY_DN23388_c0_g2_i1:71-448(+)
MPKRKADTSAPRRSVRQTSAPVRFNPCGSAGIPDAFEDMVASIAEEVCKTCPIPMSTDAMQELRGCLMPAMAVFFDAASANAAIRGSEVVEDEDFDVVLDSFKQTKSSKIKAIANKNKRKKTKNK